MRAFRTTTLLLSLLLPGVAAAQTTAWDAAIESFRQQLRTDVAADDVGGISAAVVVGDRVVWAEAFGWADREAGIPAGVETIYRTGSISKSFTAVALMQQVERGVIALDDAVVSAMPEAAGFADRPDGAPPVTFRQLASHTAGLAREPELEGAAQGPIDTWERQVLRSIPTTPYDTLPGARYSYSNIGFGTLGLAVSRAAGTPFMELVTRQIFEALGMTRSTFIVPPELERHLAKGYVNRRDGTVDTETPFIEHRGRGYKVPNGGVYSTVLDLARFIAGMTGAAGHVMLGPASRRATMTVQTPEDPDEGYGLGFSVRTTEDGHRLVGHGGSVAGYTAYLLFEPGLRIGVVLLRNYNRGETDLSDAAAELLTALVRAAGDADWPGA